MLDKQWSTHTLYNSAAFITAKNFIIEYLQDNKVSFREIPLREHPPAVVFMLDLDHPADITVRTTEDDGIKLCWLIAHLPSEQVAAWLFMYLMSKGFKNEPPKPKKPGLDTVFNMRKWGLPKPGEDK